MITKVFELEDDPGLVKSNPDKHKSLSVRMDELPGTIQQFEFDPKDPKRVIVVTSNEE